MKGSSFIDNSFFALYGLGTGNTYQELDLMGLFGSGSTAYLNKLHPRVRREGEELALLPHRHQPELGLLILAPRRTPRRIRPVQDIIVIS
jgi:hypothetical protein